MKNYYYPIVCIVLVMGLLTSCSHCKKKKCQAAYPSLEYNITDVMKWDTSKYKNLVFQFFSSSIEKDADWQLVCYGLKNPVSDTINYSDNYDKLPISTTQEKIHYVSDSVIAGNNSIPLKALQNFAQAAIAADSNVKVLIFIPTDTSGIFKDYILYHIKVLNPTPSNGKGTYLRVDSSLIAPEYRQNLKEDKVDGTNYLELNPCPPANMLVYDINHYSRYEFVTADIRLVRSMVITRSTSHTMLEATSTAS